MLFRKFLNVRWHILSYTIGSHKNTPTPQSVHRGSRSPCYIHNFTAIFIHPSSIELCIRVFYLCKLRDDDKKSVSSIYGILWQCGYQLVDLYHNVIVNCAIKLPDSNTARSAWFSIGYKQHEFAVNGYYTHRPRMHYATFIQQDHSLMTSVEARNKLYLA